MIDTQVVDGELTTVPIGNDGPVDPGFPIPPRPYIDTTTPDEDSALAYQMGKLEIVEERTESIAFERYVRINITKNTKGYSSETTISVKGIATASEIREALIELNHEARMATSLEIDIREAIDRGEYVPNAEPVETPDVIAMPAPAAPSPAHSAESIEELPF